MRRARGLGRGGPGLIGTAARTAVIAGTATAVSGRVAAAQQARVAPAPATPAAAGVAEPVPVPAPATPAPPAPLDVDQLRSQLIALGELRDAGLLTEEEFAAKKAQLLAR